MMLIPYSAPHGLVITFGKYKWQTAQELMLKVPTYIDWLAREPCKEGFEQFQRALQELLQIFDSKPFVAVSCHGIQVDGTRCRKPVTRAAVCGTVLPPKWFCDECHVSYGFVPIKTFREAMAYLRSVGARTEFTAIEIVRYLAMAKGLTKPFTQKKILDFFHDPSENPGQNTK